MRLQDKVATVTGAASGMGAATARLFAREGAKVIVADMLEAEGQAVADSIKSNSGEARFQRFDVPSETDWDAAVAATLAAYGKIDILINNAGVSGSVNSVHPGLMPAMRTSVMSAVHFPTNMVVP
jgi:NAD(P)-dependent dehydrogenase (short-subunit alcohol dehydrogenase family)